MGFSAAASVRVGNALGAGNIEQAKLSCKVPIVCACKIQCSTCAGALLAHIFHLVLVVKYQLVCSMTNINNSFYKVS